MTIIICIAIYLAGVALFSFLDNLINGEISYVVFLSWIGVIVASWILAIDALNDYVDFKHNQKFLRNRAKQIEEFKKQK